MSAGNPEIVFADKDQIDTFVDVLMVGESGRIVDMTVDWLGQRQEITFLVVGRGEDEHGMTVLVVRVLEHDNEGDLVINAETGEYVGYEWHVPWAEIYEIEFY